MRLLILWIASVGLAGILCFGASAQDATIPLVTPNKVSVTAGEPQTLVPGQAYSFQLHFDRAPNGYGSGTIIAKFENVSGALSPDLFAGRGALQPAASVSANLSDGQSMYNLNLPIAEWMSPGKWKLVEVTLGLSSQTTIPVSGNFSFDIPPLRPVVVHVQSPASVEAGKEYTIIVTLEAYPNDIHKDCGLALGVHLEQVPPNWRSVDLNHVTVSPDQLSYKFSHRFEPDFPSGSWQADVTDFPRFPRGYYGEGCRYPHLEGDVRSLFKIEPAKGLVKPTSVAVTVNPSQIQLLRGEIDRLSIKAQHLKEELNSKDAADRQALLRGSVDNALTELAATEEAYKKDGTEPSYLPVIEAFFGDIRNTYNEALKVLTNNSAQELQSEPRFIYANAIVSGASPLTDASEAVVKSIQRNINAYQVVILSGALEFDLEVRSDPQDATISYQQGKAGEFKKWHDKTNSTLQGLTRASYIIKLQKTGYGDQCVEYDGMNDRTPVIVIKLTHEDGCKQ